MFPIVRTGSFATLVAVLGRAALAAIDAILDGSA